METNIFFFFLSKIVDWYRFVFWWLKRYSKLLLQLSHFLKNKKSLLLVNVVMNHVDLIRFLFWKGIMLILSILESSTTDQFDVMDRVTMSICITVSLTVRSSILFSFGTFDHQKYLAERKQTTQFLPVQVSHSKRDICTVLQARNLQPG